MNHQVFAELERLMAANLEAQYGLLKQQVNSHFLFNSLNTLKYMTLDRLKLKILPLRIFVFAA